MANFKLPGRDDVLSKWAGNLVRDLNRQVQSVSFGDVALTPNATATIVSDSAVRRGSFIVLTPQTLSAAGAQATTFIPPALVQLGQFTIEHASNSTGDRFFSYAVHEPKERTR